MFLIDTFTQNVSHKFHSKEWKKTDGLKVRIMHGMKLCYIFEAMEYKCNIIVFCAIIITCRYICFVVLHLYLLV